MSSAVYRGVVSVDQLIDDAAQFKHDVNKRRKAAEHAPGRWFSSPPRPTFRSIAKLYWNMDYPYTAMRFAKAEVKTNPNDDQARQMLGLYLAQLGNVEEAQKQLKAAIRLAPNNPEHHQNYAISQGFLGNHQEAIEHLRTGLRLDANNAVLHLLLAKALGAQGKLEDAEKYLKTAIKLNPRLHEARNSLNLLRKAQKQK